MTELATILITLGVTGITQLLKDSPIIGNNPKIIAAIICVFFGVVYAGFQYFVPAVQQENLMRFCAFIWTGSIAAYEVIKPFVKEKK